MKIEQVKLSKLKPAEYNPRQMTEKGIRKCVLCNDFYKSYDKRRKYCSRACYVKSGVPANNIAEYTKSEFISNRNKEKWFRERVSKGLKKYFISNPRCKEGWYIQRYGINYTPKKLKRSSIWRNLSKKIRDKHNCARCGSSNKLDVHHIIPYKISKDNSLNNLVVLCRLCHKLVEDNNLKIRNIVGNWEVVRILLKDSLLLWSK